MDLSRQTESRRLAASATLDAHRRASLGQFFTPEPVARLLDAAQDRWRMINGAELVKELLDGATFKDGIKVTD